jgi:hypothetical protein
LISLVADNLEAMERDARATTLAVVPAAAAKATAAVSAAAATHRKRSFVEQCLDAMSSSVKEDAIAAPSTPIKDTTARWQENTVQRRKNRLTFYLTFT